MNLVLAALSGSLLIAVATLASWAGWQQRGITIPWPLPTLLAVQLLVGTTGPLLLNTSPLDDVYAVPGVALSLAAALALGVTAILTDISCKKIPKEPGLVAIAAGIIGCVLANGIEMRGTFNLIVAILGVVLLPFLAAIATKGLGYGDIRLLAAYTATLAWWVGVYPLLWAIMTACFLQGLIRLATRLKHVPRLPFGPALVAGFTTWTAVAVLVA